MNNGKTAFAALTLGMAMVVPLSAAHAETVRDPLMGFSISFPGDADREDLDGEMPDWVHRAVAWDQHDGRGYYNITAAQTLPDRYVYNDLPAVLRDARSECIAGDEIVSEQSIAVSGGLGGEVLTKRKEFSGTIYDLVRFAAKGNKIYCVRGTYGEGDDGSAARAFVRSFIVF